MFPGTIPIGISQYTHTYCMHTCGCTHIWTRTHTHNALHPSVFWILLLHSASNASYLSKQGRRNNCHFPCWLINWVTFVLLNFTISIGISLEAFNSAVHDSFWENKCLCRGRAKCLESHLTLLWQQSWRKVWISLYSKSRDSDINCTSSWASHFPEP